eukprot:54691_1
MSIRMKKLHQKQFIKAIQRLQIGYFKPQQRVSIIRGSVLVLSNDDMIAKNVATFEAEKKRITAQWNGNGLPLHRFTAKDICNKLQWWIYNDINFEHYLLQTMQLFTKHNLSGQIMSNLPTNSVKLIVQNQMETFMTPHTFNIMLEYLEKWKMKDVNVLKSKSAAEIGYILYTYPVHKLTKKIIDDGIDGKRLLKYLEGKETFIREEKEFSNHMDNNCLSRVSLPDMLKTGIRNTLIPFDVEELHLRIRNADDVEDLAAAIVDMMGCLKKNDSATNDVYETIAACFITQMDDMTSNHWKCRNCGNYNFSRYIEGKMSEDVSDCSLCGIRQIESIVMQIKNEPTFLMVNDIIEQSEEKSKDVYDKLIKRNDAQDDGYVWIETNERNNKYVTDLDASASNNTNYGFGMEHFHPNLSPKYCCVRDELLSNTLHQISEKLFRFLLVKAIKKHRLSLGKEVEEPLICKYFDQRYNIIRNSPIGIRHILALIVYTDLSKFCTIFRQTYRRTRKESSEQKVTQRHLELYHYSRCLLESVEFFGHYMEPDLRVYHALNKVMYFDKFTSYFNSPISTTTSLDIANEFSQGKGIILTLQSGAKWVDNPIKIPKYLSVSWLSHYPNEDEKLFYGTYVVFQIHNIVEAATGQTTELSMLNKFQQTVQNEHVEWDLPEEDEMIDALVVVIERQKRMNTNKQRKCKALKELSLSITAYGMDLFGHFCNNIDTKEVVIRRFRLLPQRIRNALFVDDGNSG